MTATDYPRLIALWEASGLTYKPKGRDSRTAIERQIESGSVILIGTETEGGELVCAILASHNGRKGWLNRLAVHPDYRRQGLAKALIAAAEDALHECGIQITAAQIEPGNEVSLELFIAAGYENWPGMYYVSKRDNDDV
jgi:ribosomal protein S18 acetylase RimI-like enzyme